METSGKGNAVQVVFTATLEPMATKLHEPKQRDAIPGLTKGTQHEKHKQNQENKRKIPQQPNTLKQTN